MTRRCSKCGSDKPATMTERPISFPGPMVRAIDEGRKTQTRRLITHRHGIHFLGGAGEENDPSCWGWAFDGPDHSGYMVLARGLNERHDHGCVSMPCPYGEVGDRMWVRETWMSYPGGHAVWLDLPSTVAPDGASRAFYREGFNRSSSQNWRSPRFMPRWASRITLEVVDVRVQRLQEISEEDARAEGIPQRAGEADAAGLFDLSKERGYIWNNRTTVENFAVLWDSINAKRAPWSSNPWVWAIDFRRIEQ